MLNSGDTALSLLFGTWKKMGSGDQRHKTRGGGGAFRRNVDLELDPLLIRLLGRYLGDRVLSEGLRLVMADNSAIWSSSWDYEEAASYHQEHGLASVRVP